jgi:uncharacterized radical SAM protein YgiQ
LSEISFLPVTLPECRKLGWEELDIIIVTGDAYVDHPAFGAAIIGRYLTANGFQVGIIPQPDWRSDEDFLKLGKPRLFFGVTAGNLDSMVNHYTAQRKIRSDDAYSPDGKAGLRPDRATIVYTQKLKRLFKGVPIILGGIEASLRRIPHYDFWSDKIRNSVLPDSKADLIVYGMAEKTILKAAGCLAEEQPISTLAELPGTVSMTNELPQDAFLLPDYEQVQDKDVFLQMTRLFQENYQQKALYQKTGLRYIRHNPPGNPLTQKELDRIYNLRFARKPHPIYKNKKIPAFEQIRNSITSHRGCFGGCNFCALSVHQGKYIQSRSISSILAELRELTKQNYFRGSVSDIGGPSANMYGIECLNINCRRRSCLVPDICPELDTSHKDYLRLLAQASAVSGINQVYVASGVRSDLALENREFIERLVKKHTGGRLKLAPEHKSEKVLKLMNKASFQSYERFLQVFGNLCRVNGLHYSVIPYIMVGHPGTTIEDAVELASYLKENNLRVEKVQEFTPTPMTISSCMYYTECDFPEGKKIHIPTGREIRLQKAIVQWFMPENRKYVIEILRKAGKNYLLSFFLEQEPKKGSKRLRQ